MGSTRLAGAWRPVMAAMLIALGSLAPAAACPDCAESRTARHQAWTEGFGFNLFATTLPLIVIAGVVILVEYLGRSPKR